MDLSEFESFYRRNFNILCNKVYKIINDKDEAQDIVQEVFIKFWDERENIKPDNKEAYIYKAAINKTLNRLDSHKRKSQNNKIYSLTQTPQNSISLTEQEIYQDELQQKINHVINILPPACRNVFILSRFEELSYKEIAEHLSISENTVDNHIKKALSIFRKYILSLVLIFLKYFKRE